MTATHTRITITAQSLSASTIANRIWSAKEHGYTRLKTALRELRDVGAIVIKERLTGTKVALEALADRLIAEFEAIAKTEEVQKIKVDDDRSLRCRLPKGAIVCNFEAMKVGHSETDVWCNIWRLDKGTDFETIYLTPTGYGHFMALAGDALMLAAYFDRPIFTRHVTAHTGDHALAATYIDRDDVEAYKLRAIADGRFHIKIDFGNGQSQRWENK